ncbi:MAG: hypothetical protein H6629_17385 [Calditrichae bacterium]|nr:hypothetical protein [Calditrichia bacterium]
MEKILLDKAIADKLKFIKEAESSSKRRCSKPLKLIGEVTGIVDTLQTCPKQMHCIHTGLEKSKEKFDINNYEFQAILWKLLN